MDRTLTNGFAFAYNEQGVPEGLLKGKTAQLYVSTGTPNEHYEQSGMHTAQRRVIDEGVFGFCGIKCTSTFFGNVAMGTDEERKVYLESIK